MLYHLFIAGRRKCGEEGEEVTVTFEHILRFTTGAETEPLLGFQIAPSVIFSYKQFMHKPAGFTTGRELVLVPATK